MVGIAFAVGRCFFVICCFPLVVLVVVVVVDVVTMSFPGQNFGNVIPGLAGVFWECGCDRLSRNSGSYKPVHSSIAVANIARIEFGPETKPDTGSLSGPGILGTELVWCASSLTGLGCPLVVLDFEDHSIRFLYSQL